MTPASVNALELLRGVLRPRRTRVGAAVSIADGAAGSGRAAWQESLRQGLLHGSPVGRRVFWPEAAVGACDPPCPGEPTEWPPDVGACASLASDPEGSAAAEEQAVALGRASARWGGREVSSVAWRFAPRSEWLASRSAATPHMLRGARSRDDTPLGAAWSELWGAATEDEFAAAQASIQSEVGRRTGRHVAEEWALSDLLQCRLWASVAPGGAACPFCPLVKVWSLGYAVDGIDGAMVTLVCPRLDDGSAFRGWRFA